MQTLVTLFYTDDRILASPLTDNIQGPLDVLMGLFDKVGLRKNVNKTVRMVYQPCCTLERQSAVAYTWRMYNGGGTLLQVKETVEDPVPRLRDRTGGWIHDSTPPHPEWMG